MAVHNWWGEAR